MSAIHRRRRRSASACPPLRGTMPKPDTSDPAAACTSPPSSLRARLQKAVLAARRSGAQLSVDARSTQIIAVPTRATDSESPSAADGSLALSDEALRDAYRVLQVFGGSDLETMLELFRADLVRYGCHPSVAAAREAAIRPFLAEALGPAAAARSRRER